MDIADIIKYAVMVYLIAIGMWFNSASGKFHKGSKKTLSLYLILIFALITEVATVLSVIYTTVPEWRLLVTVTMATISAVLIKWAFQTISQNNFGLIFGGVVPEEVVQHGPYKYIRHPLYTAYSIFWMSCVVYSASLIAGIAAAVVIILYLWAIHNEEKNILNSDVGTAYQAYRKRTGMMVPRLFKGE